MRSRALCTPSAASTAAACDDREILVDAAGVRHRPAGPGARIVCLVPSITELLCDLGLAGQLVGRTGFCIHPRETVRTIPRSVEPKMSRSSGSASSLPRTSSSTSTRTAWRRCDELSQFVSSVIVTHPLGPLDNLELYRLLGGIFGREEEANQLETAFAGRAPAPARGQPSPTRRALSDLARAVDDRVARHLHLPHAGARKPTHGASRRRRALSGRRPASLSGKVDRVLLSSEPFRFRDKHIPEVAALVPRRRCESHRRRDDILVRQPRHPGPPVPLPDNLETPRAGAEPRRGVLVLAGETCDDHHCAPCQLRVAVARRRVSCCAPEAHSTRRGGGWR